jgi:hypothetical protein
MQTNLKSQSDDNLSKLNKPRTSLVSGRTYKLARDFLGGCFLSGSAWGVTF